MSMYCLIEWAGISESREVTLRVKTGLLLSIKMASEPGLAASIIFIWYNYK